MTKTVRRRDGRPRVLLLVIAAAALLLAFPGRAVMFDIVLRQMLYPAPPVNVPQAPAPLEEVSLALPGGETLVAWGNRAPGSPRERPVALFFHGNGENLETMRRAGLFHRLDGLDLPYLALDYPGYGRSQGEPSEEALVAGAEAALDHVARQHPGRPVVAVGWSLGAAVAVQLADRHPERVQAVVFLSAWTRLADVAAVHFPAFLSRPATRGRYESLATAPRVRVPALVIHGLADRIIPAEQGERLAGTLAGPVRWVAVPHAGHNDLLRHEVVWDELKAFFVRTALD